MTCIPPPTDRQLPEGRELLHRMKCMLGKVTTLGDKREKQRIDSLAIIVHQVITHLEAPKLTDGRGAIIPLEQHE